MNPFKAGKYRKEEVRSPASTAVPPPGGDLFDEPRESGPQSRQDQEALEKLVQLFHKITTA